MALPKQRLGHRCGTPGANVEVEYFLDLMCPFSKKSLILLHDQLLQKYGDKVLFTVHLFPQPWHAQGVWVLETAIAVGKIAGNDAQFSYIRKFYDHQNEFNDASVFSKSREQVYNELAQFAAKETGISVDEIKKRIIPNLPDTNAVIADVKAAVKYGRKRAMHVTPTVFVNGIEATDHQSSWTITEFSNMLDPLLK